MSVTPAANQTFVLAGTGIMRSASGSIRVAKLSEALADPTIATEARDLLRGLIDRIVIHPSTEGPQVEVTDDIVPMIALGLGTDSKTAAPLSEDAASSVKLCSETVIT